MSRAKPPPPRPPRPFRQKLAVLGVLLATLPLLGAGWFFLEANRNALERAQLELQLAVAEDVAARVGQHLSRTQDDLDALARILTRRGLDAETTEALALELVASAEALDHATIHDAEGRPLEVVRAGELAPTTDSLVPLAPTLRAAAEARGYALGEVALDAADHVRVPVVLPLQVPSPQDPATLVTTGFTATLLSLEPLQREVVELGALRFGEEIEALLLLDEERRVVARSGAGALLDDHRSGAVAGLPAGTLPPGVQRSGEYPADPDSPTSETMVGTVVSVPGAPWLVVAQVPARVVYADYRALRWLVFGVLGLALLLAIVAALLMARAITRPIDELAGFANDLAARRFDKRLTLNTRDELAVLGQVMSHAAAELEESEHRIREEAAIRNDLGRYLPGELVERVVRRNQDMKLGGERRPVSVLFADVVAFTPITDRLAAEEVVSLLNELFTILTETVFRHGGTIDKFIGDCMMAIWNAPQDQDDHAARALAAAEDMMRWLEAGNAGWSARFGVRVELAIGINTGEAIVGNVGSERRMEYTAIGDVVNVAARLEAIARPMQILVTAATHDAVEEASFDFRHLGERTLTGRAESVDLWEVRP